MSENLISTAKKKQISLPPKCLFQNDSESSPLKAGDGDGAKTESSDRKLKEHLGNLILSQNLLVLFGSGASVAIGGPSMSDLWETALESKKETFKDVCEAVDYDQTDKNIEKLMSRCQRAREFKNSKDNLIKDFIEKVEEIIHDKCRKITSWEKVESCTKSISEKIEPHTILLSRVVPRRQDLPRTQIFTTNYDLCIETAAKEQRMPILDGFDLTHPRIFDGRWYDYDFVRRSAHETAPNYLESVFHLYKLHGSVDWHRSEDGSIIQNSETRTPYLIYPRDEKFALSFEQPFLEMMSRFQMSLRERDTALLIIGYGFNDHHINQPIYHAIATNPSFKAFVVDYSPETKMVKGKEWDTLLRLQSAGAPLDILQTDFEDFAKLLPTYSQARSHNTQEKTSKLLKALSEKI